MNDAPIGEMVILVVILGALMLTERAVGYERFWSGLGKIALVGLIIVVVFGVISELAAVTP